MRIFISAGEPSGDLHGANLIQALHERDNNLELFGFGGEKMQAAGCQLVYPLCNHAVMGVLRVFSQLTTFLKVLSWADRWFRHHRPDAVVLIDYPGLHWWLARRAHYHGIPVFYFVPPQIWAWASWRVKKMQRWVDHVLCSLPFEEEWYQQRNVNATYIGHPYFDELDQQQRDQQFLEQQRQQHTGPVIALLPGSRTQEVQQNISTMFRSALRVHRQMPEARFLVACFEESHKHYVQQRLQGHALPIIPYVGRTPEIIELADVCLAVSGSVSLELLYQAKPTVIVYKISRFAKQVSKLFLQSRYITLVNLLAEKELFPELLTDECESRVIAAQLMHWLQNAEDHAKLRGELIQLRERVGQPGACQRAAEYILNALKQQKLVRREAA